MCRIRQKLLWLGFGLSFCCAFPTIYAQIIVNQTMDTFQQLINISYYARYLTECTETKFSLIWSAVTNIIWAGAFFGAITMPFLSDGSGRRTTMIISTFPALAGGALQIVGVRTVYYEFLLAGRFLTGVTIGIGLSIGVMYLNEVTPSEHRGLMGSMQELNIAWIGLILTAVSVKSTSGTIVWLVAVQLLPSIVMLIIGIILPESPSYLLITKNDELAAIRSIQFFSGGSPDSTKDMIESMKREKCQLQKEGNIFERRLWHSVYTKYRNNVLLGTVALLSQTFSGINVVVMFSTNMFQNAGVSKNVANYLTIGLGLLNVVVTTAMLPLVDRLGRRPLLLISLGACLVCGALYSICDIAHHYTEDDRLVYPTVVFMVLLVFVYSIGAGPVVWFYVSEVIPFAQRAASQTTAMSMMMLCNLIMGYAFYPLYVKIGAFSFLLLFTLPSMLCFVYLYRNMIETKQTEIVDICEHLNENL